jgi:aspartyl-tRNA(Asn)/glutamyl-tRNA(Gln) amidotransferase subunit A
VEFPLTLSALHAGFNTGAYTCQSIVQHYLSQINAKQHLNAFLEVFLDEALERARQLDEKKASGQKLGRLFGLVISIKDNICYKDHQVSASSKILENFVSLYSSTVVERLLAEDAIIIGRTNCDEFAMGSSNEKSAYGKVLNPVDETRVPGGSSGGAAVSVAAGLCMASLGTDTGGSIRQPASYTGLVGLKPTYGRVSRHGIIAYASSFDQVGPFTNNVEDAFTILSVISGKDEFDATLSQRAVPGQNDFSQHLTSDKKLRFAYFKECLDNEGMNPEVTERFNALMADLIKMGHSVEPVSFPYLDYLVPAYYVLTTAEASSNLSRYDGIHFGYRSPNASDLESTYKLSRSEGFGKEVKRRIMLGTFVLSEGYYDAYYGQAQKVRRLIREKTLALFQQFDFLLTPTTPSVAFQFGQKSADPVAMYLEDIFTVQANLAGIPAASIPLGKTKEALPYGLQLMAAPFAEPELLAACKKIEDFLTSQRG